MDHSRYKFNQNISGFKNKNLRHNVCTYSQNYIKSSNFLKITWNIIPNFNSSIFKRPLQTIGSVSW